MNKERTFSKDYNKKRVEEILNSGDTTWQEKKDLLADFIDVQVSRTTIEVMNLIRTKKISASTPNGEVIKVLKENEVL